MLKYQNIIIINESKFLISHTADDTTFTLNGAKNVFKHYKIIKIYAKIRVNVDKTKVVWIIENSNHVIIVHISE